MFALRYKKIGAKIVFYRKLKSMTQEKLADEVGITPQYLSRIENGGYSKNVSLSTLMKIAGVLDVTMSQLKSIREPEAIRRLLPELVR